MGRKRKTFDIAELLHTVNKRNASSTCTADVRAGWNSLLETVLMGADLYAGYGYLEQKDLKGSATGEKPGIEFREVFGDIPGPCDSLITAGEFFDALSAMNAYRERRGEPGLHTPFGKARVFPDESRRVYYVAQTIRDAYSKLEAQATLEQANSDRAMRRDMLERSRRPEEKGAMTARWPASRRFVYGPTETEGQVELGRRERIGALAWDKEAAAARLKG